MNKNVRPIFVGLSVICLTMLSACGGGGSTPASGSAEGLWHGKLSGTATASIIVLDTGEFWALYGGPAYGTGIFTEAGVVHGTSTAKNGSFVSTDAVDSYYTGADWPATISGSYVERKTLDGTLNYTTLNQVVNFTSTFDDNYLASPSLASLAGTYTALGASLPGMTISATGGITLSWTDLITGKVYSDTGTAVQHQTGNVYDITINLPGVYKGIGYFDGAHTLWITVLDASGNNYTFMGQKP